MPRFPNLLLAMIACLLSFPLFATDLLRLSGSAASDGSGGVIGLGPTAQSALLANPALLGVVEDGVSFSLASLRVNSEFMSSSGETSTADKGPGIIPGLAIKGTAGDSDWSWGAGLVVQSAMRADFTFVDPPGTGGVSYGRRQHMSEWVIAKAQGALSYRLSERLSAGVSLGVAYNRNRLRAPYIFQSHPLLTGLKVLVDLEVDDFALSSSLGVHYDAGESLAFHLGYVLERGFSADGELSGNLGQLGLGIQETFLYAANVQATQPAVAVAGATWRASDRLTLGLQFDRVFWENAFEQLPIRLTRGNNAQLNDFLGGDGIADNAPLNWNDQDSVHLGGEYRLRAGGILRLGYENSEAPVPTRTFTPMTGAILDEAYSIGLQFTLNRRDYDIAYRYSRGDDIRVVDSGLAGGEYDNTGQSLALHSLSLSFRF